MRRRLLQAGFVLAAVLTLFFVIRAVLFAVFWMDPERGLHPVEPWMTPRYIMRVYDLPRDDLADALGLERGDSPRQPLEKLAEQHGISVQDLIDGVEVLIATRRAQ